MLLFPPSGVGEGVMLGLSVLFPPSEVGEGVGNTKFVFVTGSERGKRYSTSYVRNVAYLMFFAERW